MKIKSYLLIYKKNIPLRVVVVLAVSCLLWIGVSGGLREAIAAPIIVGLFEYMTINVIFDRVFYPLDMFADDIFPDRNSLGYKALYVGFYIIFWLVAFYYLINEYH